MMVPRPSAPTPHCDIFYFRFAPLLLVLCSVTVQRISEWQELWWFMANDIDEDDDSGQNGSAIAT